MGITKKTNYKGKDIISASEIGNYHYCSIAWYLQKCGYKPKSQMLDIGRKKHVELGRIIDYTQVNFVRGRAFAIAGYLMLILGILILLFEVIL